MEIMTARERFLASCRFQPVDRIPYREIVFYGQAIDRWLSEGLPADVNIGRIYDGSEYFGFDRWEFVPINLDIYPPFDEVVLEEDERVILYIDHMGVKRKAIKEGIAHGHWPSMDQYFEFPVKDRADFINKMKPRYNSKSPGRYPQWWDDRVRVWSQRDYPLVLPDTSGYGFFSTLRRWMGTEAACTVFYDDPKLVHEILDYMTDFAIETYSRALIDLEIDYFEIWEDFAFKDHPFVGPKLFQEFLAPYYRRLIDFVRSHGVEFVAIDTDGNPWVLIPYLLDVGVNVIWPVEVAAGMDAVKLRQEFGHDLILWGGIDKREIAKGKGAIEREVYRQMPQLIEDGGYIPTLDGGWPASISYDNFCYFLELKRKVAEGREGA
jgi:uroporphyrinogen decarboxylase